MYTQLCDVLDALIPGFGATCNFLIQSQLPGIIDGLVNDNLNPEQVTGGRARNRGGLGTGEGKEQGRARNRVGQGTGEGKKRGG